MGCLSYAIDGKCCQCFEQVAEEGQGHFSDKITEIETRSGTHYVCDDCLRKTREKYEKGEIDIFEIK